MEILVIGSGGREDAICKTLLKSKKVKKVYCLPGNGGISDVAECVDIDVMDFDKIIKFLIDNPQIDMTVVAPDDPLVAGLVDDIEKIGRRAFGPNAKAAIIEGSKVFSKNLMQKYNIPTAKYQSFNQFDSAVAYINEQTKFPLVVKADGLALGKGVIICNSKEEAIEAARQMLIDSKFNKAGKTIVVEEFLSGKEVSILVFCDGDTFVPMVSAQDHKRALDNDEGLNTGGMGTFSPSKYYTKDVERSVTEKIIIPTIRAMEKEGRVFKGVLYFGLMLTEDGPKTLEYNARFGDPETQVILPKLKTDLVDIFDAVIDGKLDKIDIEWQDMSTVCVICASGGYPQEYKKNLEITFSDDLDRGVEIFYAGVSKKEGKLFTNGGRVLGVVASGGSIEEAREKAYKNIEKIHFENMHYRKDIGIK